MQFNSKNCAYNEGMDASPGSDEIPIIDLYALVTYLPNPLGAYLNSLRRELVPDCHLRAHVTVLPPRVIPCGDSGWKRIQREAQEFPPIEIDLGDVEVFEETSVIYLSIQGGRKELIQLHDHLAHGSLAYQEPYQFHPHITLAQGLTGEALKVGVDHARRRWRAFQGRRSFTLDSMTFVRSTTRDVWMDLGEVELEPVKVGYVR